MTKATRRLDLEVQNVIDVFAQAFPRGFAGAGVERVREFGRQGDALVPTGPAMHSVVNTDVPGVGGSSIPIRVYKPTSRGLLPVLIYLHGGGWCVGSINGSVDYLCRSIAAAADIAVISVDYRLAPEHKAPAAVEDVMAVLDFVRASPESEGLDSVRIAIGGDSAGANISAAVTHLDRDRGERLAAQILLYPATEYAVNRPSWVDNANAPILTAADTLWFWDQYLATPDDRRDPRMVPALSRSFKDLPPGLILVAEFDPLRDDGLHYAELLRSGGTEVRTQRYERACHGFMTMPGLRDQVHGVEIVASFLRDALAPV